MQLIVANHFLASVASLTYNPNHILSNDADSGAYRFLSPSFSFRSGRLSYLYFVRCVESSRRTRREDHDAFHGWHMLLPFPILGPPGTTVSIKSLSPGATPLAGCFGSCCRAGGLPSFHVSRSYLRSVKQRKPSAALVPCPTSKVPFGLLPSANRIRRGSAVTG